MFTYNTFNDYLKAEANTGEPGSDKWNEFLVQHV